ncbi:wall-associated receptor kinase 5-like [Papaver somniferum]|uniref:wall-associated receptor kinase 5-like n=1 Tax=Papaver somniferum TaxID=3469 RepID=UPI000E703948|nr:wall-associated receptor kinase 5-like [Papaver somniferum]
MVPATTGSGLYNIRSMHNNKYLSHLADDHIWITAIAVVPDEDQNSKTCTLFKPVLVLQKKKKKKPVLVNPLDFTHAIIALSSGVLFRMQQLGCSLASPRVPLAASFSWLTLATSSSASIVQAKPGCQEKCGDVTIPYPFGIGPSENGCSRAGAGYLAYNITCDTTYPTPKPFIRAGQNLTSGVYNMIEVISISEKEVRVKSKPAIMCSDSETGEVILSESPDWMNFNKTPYTVSYTKNSFFGVGCHSLGYLLESPLMINTTCPTVCTPTENLKDGSCNGTGCCQTTVHNVLRRFLNVIDSSRSKNVGTLTFNPCSYSFIGESDKYTFSVSDLTVANFKKKAKDIPIVLDWAIGNKACDKITPRELASYACQGNSTCSNSDKVPGYHCICNPGFEGNPYLIPGCQASLVVNEGGTGSTNNVPLKKTFPTLKAALGVALILLICLIAGSIWLYLRRRESKSTKLKRKFFHMNGGLLLKQKILSNEGGIEGPKIFTAEELELATQNYDDKLILGRGGFGIVYKGTLSDKRVVAIKVSKVIDASQIKQFINEIAILTQVIHRNLVKVLGCCLETEVPLLVYEYVSNGTLAQHIHNNKADEMAPTSYISWKNRLRIAAEAAGGLAYLHSGAPIPIIHRDVKSCNILLNENYTAKISDFGVSRLNPSDQTQIDTMVQGTLGYLDPEYFQSSQLTEKSDVYSFGVVLVELLTGERPLSYERPDVHRNLSSYFIYKMEKSHVFRVIDPHVVTTGKWEHVMAVAELARRCLNMNGVDRPTMKQVAVELENLSKLDMDTKMSGTSASPELTNLYSIPTSSYTSGDSALYSTDRDVITSKEMLR